MKFIHTQYKIFIDSTSGCLHKLWNFPLRVLKFPFFCRSKSVLELLDKNYRVHASLNDIVSANRLISI